MILPSLTKSTTWKLPPAKACAAVIATLTICFVLLQLIITTGHHLELGRPLYFGFFRLLGYYTHLMNGFVGYSMLQIARGKWQITDARIQSRMGFLTVQIFLVAFVYHVFLRGTWDPKGLFIITDAFFHSFNPLVSILFWLFLMPKNQLKYKDAGYWTLCPLIYFVYAIVRGLLTDWFPYPFLDVNKIGWQKVAINSSALALVFWVLGLGVVWIGLSVSVKSRLASGSRLQE